RSASNRKMIVLRIYCHFKNESLFDVSIAKMRSLLIAILLLGGIQKAESRSVPEMVGVPDYNTPYWCADELEFNCPTNATRSECNCYRRLQKAFRLPIKSECPKEHPYFVDKDGVAITDRALADPICPPKQEFIVGAPNYKDGPWCAEGLEYHYSPASKECYCYKRVQNALRPPTKTECPEEHPYFVNEKGEGACSPIRLGESEQNAPNGPLCFYSQEFFCAKNGSGCACYSRIRPRRGGDGSCPEESEMQCSIRCTCYERIQPAFRAPTESECPHGHPFKDGECSKIRVED
ncbi:hypothetical protein PRIPAC_91394, partial [Pristionchus pacificus]|uniref:Uncharacterized protein n=1 Tax=Pristionchus pacificus TaxID=54126 RepID=A0A2A6CTD9_PRIPA